MPVFLSVIVIGAIVLFGIVQSFKGLGNRHKAKKIAAQAKKLYQEAKDRLEKAHDETKNTLVDLGKLKLNVWSQQVGRFADLFEWLKDVKVTGRAQVGELQTIQEGLADIKQKSFNASEMVQGGTAALVTGALVGFTSYGGATMLASASTGTAIASLSGAAATNATLAWFGGGSLAAGGLGMAGGTMILGGIVAAPVLAVGGLIFNAKAREMLAQAQEDLALAQKSATEMGNAAAITRAIQKAASACHETIEELRDRVEDLLDDFEQALILNLHQAEVRLKKVSNTRFANFLWWFGIGRPRKLKTLEGESKEGRRISYRLISEDDKRDIHLTFEMIFFLKRLLEIPLLDDAGALQTDYRRLIEKSRKYLPDPNP